MKKLKVIHLAFEPWADRWTSLKEILSAQGVDLEVEVLETPSEKLGESIEKVRNSDADACILDGGFYDKVFSHLQQTTDKVIHEGACDTLIKEKGGWWPRTLLPEALIRIVSKNISQINLEAHALIVGDGGEAKLVVEAMALLGFIKINITGDTDERGMKIVEEMKKRYYNIQFSYIPFQEVTRLPGVHSIAVNTTKLNLENVLLDELYFFNFLETQGVVMDFNIIPPVTPLIEEAKVWGARHLSGDYIATSLDVCLVEKILGLKIDVEAYRKSFFEKANAVPFDKTPYLKRFRERGN